MTRAPERVDVVRPRLRDLALALMAETRPAMTNGDHGECLRRAAALGAAAERVNANLFELCVRSPVVADEPLVTLSHGVALSPVEMLTVALAAAVEDDPRIGRLLAHVQAPLPQSRPTLGLLASCFDPAASGQGDVVPALLNGVAMKCGLLALLGDEVPLPERAVMVPAPLCLALSGHDGEWPGTTIAESASIPLPASIEVQARHHAAALAAEAGRGLIVRTGSPLEGRSVAELIAGALGLRAAFIETDKVAGFGPWLRLRHLLPVFCHELAPGERKRLPALPGYSGPVLAVCGPDGSIEMPHASPANWVLPIPAPGDRRKLWVAALRNGPEAMAEPDASMRALADELAVNHRHGTGRIAHLGRLARHEAALVNRAIVDRSDVLAAAWTGEGGGLDALAEPLRAAVPDDALVASPALRAELDALMLRCRLREDLAEGLGASARTRYRPGVRALFTGSSGTGKTLAAGWMATRLGLPLYRVDLASVTSKYIGETEKNLSQLLARAEHAEVILLFDEADSLFGKRTDIADANDRFANAQTNYLLQRIENYDGIVLLTSNSQARFDEAFARRLDFVIDFPSPGPDERRALWQSHLGPQTALSAFELNQLAVHADLNGGQTRNVVLAAAVHARRAGRPIAFADLLAGVEAELRKTGHQMPITLAPSS